LTKLTVGYQPTFIRQLKKLSVDVITDALEEIELFRDPSNHERLRVHKLKGNLSGQYSFSVTYSHRVIFEYIDEETVRLFLIGNHDQYKK